MKKLLESMFVCAFILFVSAMQAHFCSAGSLVFASEEYPPYIYTENGTIKGIDVEIIQAASKRLGIEAQFRLYPWARAMSIVKEGKNDAITSLFRTPEREEFLYFPSEPMCSEKNILVTDSKSHRQASTLDDISGWRIGVVKDNSYGKDFDENKNIIRIEVASIEQLVRMASAGNRFDATVLNELVFNFKAKELGLTGNLKKLDLVVTDQPLYLGFSKAMGQSHKKLAEDYSTMLKKLREEGVIDQIIKKYVGI